MIEFRNVIYRLELPSGGAGLSDGNRFSLQRRGDVNG
jgi:hypothetical protein